MNEWLRLGKYQSYRLVPATPSGRIRSDTVIMLLNRSRRGIEEPFGSEAPAPHDLLTPEETATRFGVTARELRRWTHRIRRTAPHFRFNRSTLRFSESLFERWLKENSAA